MSNPQHHDRRMPVRKKAAFGLLVTVVFFLLWEGLLALCGIRPVLETRDPFVGFAADIPLFVEQTGDNGETVLTTAANKLTFFNAQQFPRTKPSGTFRIFCVGGSTTYGRPYDDTTSFSGWLRELLPMADGSQKWEVINAGGISYAGYRVSQLMRELSRYQPDLFIVYAGHNEFLEERTYRGMIQTPKPLLRASALLSRSRTYAVLQRALSPPSRRAPQSFLLPGEVETLLDQTVGPGLYQRDDVLRKQVFNHFELNLARTVEIARAADAEVLFIVPASNLKDASPFKSLHDQSLLPEQLTVWKTHHEAGQHFEDEGALQRAIAAYRQAERIDGRFADLHYRLGRVLFQLGRHDEAKTSFQRARDEDICPLRAPGEIAKIVRRVAEDEGLPLVDYERLIETRCRSDFGHTMAGNEFFLDHVHPTIEGHRLLAVALVEKLNDMRIARLGGSWNERAVTDAAGRINDRIDPIAHARALRNLSKVLGWAGKHEEAGPLALKALETIPDDPEALYVTGAYYRSRGEIEKADAFQLRARRQQ